MGIFFRVQSPALFADLPINFTQWEEKNLSPDYITGIYNQQSTNCFIAAGLYVGIFAVSFVMWRINKRNNYMAA